MWTAPRPWWRRQIPSRSASSQLLPARLVCHAMICAVAQLNSGHCAGLALRMATWCCACRPSVLLWSVRRLQWQPKVQALRRWCAPTQESSSTWMKLGSGTTRAAETISESVLNA